VKNLFSTFPPIRSSTLKAAIQFAKQPQAPLRYIFVAWVTATIPALMVAFVLDWIGASSPHGAINPEFERRLFYLGPILFAPAIETLMMIPVFGVLRFFTQRTGWLCFWSAAAWAAFHGVFSWTWGLTVFWIFFVYSIAFLTWEPRGKKWAFFVTTLIHSLNNSVAVLLMVLGPKLG
jgi:hypothetical protein